MTKIAIPKIRPVAWKIYVQGENEAECVSRALQDAGIDTTQPGPEPGLTDPPLYAFVATPRAEVTLTEEEVAAILNRDENFELTFNSS